MEVGVRVELTTDITAYTYTHIYIYIGASVNEDIKLAREGRKDCLVGVVFLAMRVFFHEFQN